MFPGFDNVSEIVNPVLKVVPAVCIPPVEVPYDILCNFNTALAVGLVNVMLVASPLQIVPVVFAIVNVGFGFTTTVVV